MKDKFEIVYQRLIKARLNENILCRPYWRKVMELRENFTDEKCWYLLTDNIQWMLLSSKYFGLDFDIITTTEIRSWFTKEELNANGIFTEGEHEIVDDYAIGLGTAKIIASGHSRILLFDAAKAECYDTTFVSGFHNSGFIVSGCVGDAFNNCKAVAKSYAKIEAWDNAFIQSEGYSYVIRHGDAIVENSSNSHTVLV